MKHKLILGASSGQTCPPRGSPDVGEAVGCGRGCWPRGRPGTCPRHSVGDGHCQRRRNLSSCLCRTLRGPHTTSRLEELLEQPGTPLWLLPPRWRGCPARSAACPARPGRAGAKPTRERLHRRSCQVGLVSSALVVNRSRVLSTARVERSLPESP